MGRGGADDHRRAERAAPRGRSRHPQQSARRQADRQIDDGQEQRDAEQPWPDIDFGRTAVGGAGDPLRQRSERRRFRQGFRQVEGVPPLATAIEARRMAGAGPGVGENIRGDRPRRGRRGAEPAEPVESFQRRQRRSVRPGGCATAQRDHPFQHLDEQAR